MSNEKQGTGWIVFAGIMLLIAGLAMFVVGLSILGATEAQLKAQFGGTLPISDNNFDVWGWFYLVLGAIIFVAGVGVFSRAQWAVYTGIFAAGVQFVAALFFSFNPNYWGATMGILLLDVLIIHGLTRYGLVDETV